MFYIQAKLIKSIFIGYLVNCPVGTFSQSGYCMPCLIGFYQDETGHSSCQPCPDGLSTKFKGSRNITDCSGLLPYYYN